MKKIIDEYETITSIDENGREKKKAVYRGDYSEITMDPDQYLRFRKTSFAYLLVIAVLHFVAGFVANQGMYQFYIALPYTVAFFPMLYLGLGIFHLPNVKRKFQSDEIRLSFDRMKTSSIALLLILGIGVIGELVYLILFSLQGQRGSEFLYLMLEMITTILVYFLFLSRKRVVFVSLGDEKAG